MRLIIVLSIVIAIQVSLSSSLCTRSVPDSHVDPSTEQTAMTTENDSKLQSAPEVEHPDATESRSSMYSALNSSSRDHQVSSRAYAYSSHGNYHDKLRIEYYKYRILSRLNIDVDPDSISYKPIHPDLRHKLAQNHSDLVGNNNAKGRKRRALRCDKTSDKQACCLETFYVNFTEIGWDKWILYPPGYNANYCHGQCDLSNAKYYHSTLLSKFNNMIGLCCAPRQVSALQLLYIDKDNIVQHKVLPDMIVESCECA